MSFTYVFQLFNLLLHAFQFGAPNGFVFIFHVPSSVPQVIKDMASDPNIFCIQSSAFADKCLLNDVSTLVT